MIKEYDDLNVATEGIQAHYGYWYVNMHVYWRFVCVHSEYYDIVDVYIPCIATCIPKMATGCSLCADGEWLSQHD